MEFEGLKRAKNCLFCQEVTCIWPSEIEIKKEVGVVDDDLLLDTHLNDLPSIVKLQLKPIFIVRKLLEIPEEKCAEYIQQNEGKSSPSSWFGVCQSCGACVEDGYKIYNEIKHLEHKLERIKVKLKRLLLTSSERVDCDDSDKRRTRRSKELEKGRDFVRADIRKFVTEVNSYFLDDNQGCTEVPYQKTVEKVELLKWKDADVCNPQSSGEDSDPDDGANDANYKDTEWQPVFDDGESDAPILKEEQQSDDYDNDKDYKKSSRARKRKCTGKRRPKRRKEDVILSHTTTPVEQANDKPIQRKPVMTVYLFRCELCVAIYRVRKSLDTHKALHVKNEGIPCEQCGWLCSNETTLMNHCVKHHNKARPPQPWWRPPPKNFVPKYEYKPKEEIPFYCDHCHMIFVSKLFLIRHIEYNHRNIESLPCNLCDSKFPTKQILEFHLEEEHNTPLLKTKKEEISNEESQIQMCEHCSESFTTKMKRDYHIAKAHKDILLTCKICGHKSTKYSKLALHKRQKHPGENDLPFLCEHCPKSFMVKDTLYRHLRIDHFSLLRTDETLVCKECNVAFLKPSGLKRHLSNGHGQPKTIHCCEYCGKVLSTARQLKSHILRHTAPKMKKVKPVVQRKRKPKRKRSSVILAHTTTPSQVKVNTRPVITVYLHKCKLCIAGYRNRKEIDAHRALHTGNQGIPCPECGWLCSTERTLLNHGVKHHNKARPPQPWWRKQPKNIVSKFVYKPKEDIPYYCDHCHMIFISKLFLVQHVQRHHSSIAYLPCSFCDSTFPTKQTLELHCKDEHPSSSNEDDNNKCLETPVEDPQEKICEYCSVSFPSKLKRDYHIAKHHKDMLLTCKVCGYKAEKYYKLLLHKRTKHNEGNQEYVCEHCARSFYDPKYLNQHVKLSHYTELGIDKPLICKECNVSFMSPSILQNHINMVHKKIKEHCCEHCGKAFARATDLKRHILLHTVPREQQYKKGPFFCQICQAKFNVRQALYYHMKRHHADQYTIKCEYCGTGYITQNTLLQHLRKCKKRIT